MELFVSVPGLFLISGVCPNLQSTLKGRCVRVSKRFRVAAPLFPIGSYPQLYKEQIIPEVTSLSLSLPTFYG